MSALNPFDSLRNLRLPARRARWRALPLLVCMTGALSAAALLKSESRGQDSRVLALLPFENVSGSVDSVRLVMPLIERRLREKGYQIAAPEKIELFLSRNRIRNSGMMSRGQLSDLRREFGVDLALLGSVDLYYESAQNPQWGVSSRVVSTREGNILWAESTGRTGGDFTTMLGLGTITSGSELAEKVVEIMFETLPPAGTPFPAPQGSKSWTLPWLGAKAGYRSPSLDSAPRWRAAVATFENFSERRGAGRILADVFTTALFQHGRFQVIDPGEVNEALIALGRTPYGGLDAAALKEFKSRTGIDALFLGTVYRYNEGLKREASSSPDVALDITMLDVENGKILWFAVAERGGDDSQIALDFGVIRSMLRLIRRAVGEILETL